MRRYDFFCVLSGLLFCASVMAGPAEQLDNLIEEHWAWTLASSPELKTYLGDSSGARQWDDMSLSAFEARDAQRAKFLEQLAKLRFEDLEPEAKLNHSMLTRQLDFERKRQALGLHFMTISMREGPQQLYTISETMPFTTVADYENWLARLAEVPVVVKQHTALLQAGIKGNRVQARIVMQRIPAQLDKILVDDPRESPFYKPFSTMPADMDAAESSRLQVEARRLIAEKVNPAYRDFRVFFVDDYLPATREQPGVGSLAGGREIYELLARDFTTTELTPQEIHDIGKQEVQRILAEMEEVRQQVKFEGDLTAFNNFLRTDPQFYYDSPEALLAGYRDVAKKIDPELVNLFTVLPRMPYGVKPIPEEIAPDTTTAYYMPPASNGSRAGFYYVNLHRPEVRPKYEMEVLSVHEAVPGHHLQIALGMETDSLPMFRKVSSITAFVEGWALYSEQLGYQIGLYSDPYSRYGQLTYDMWRAVRLVVDTGMHYFGWSREKAIEYFKANAGKTEADIINEIDRYIGWPGQALAYKVGQMKILELREMARQRLGKQFDIRLFHDELLGAGAIPLDALERRMLDWVKQREATVGNADPIGQGNDNTMSKG